jgi:hypothetical protein
MSKKPSKNTAFLSLGTFSLALSLLWFFVISTLFIGINSSYIYEADHVGDTQIYDAERAEWSDLQETMQRSDVFLEDMDGAVLVRSIFRGIDSDGNILFEASSRYAVDPITRENLAGFIEEDREGHFGFPVNTQKQDYLFHSPEIVEEAAMAVYEGEETIDGLRVYRFAYSIEELDKTEFFPDFLSAGHTVIGYHAGTLWVEPVSGYLVDFDHNGENWVLKDSDSSDYEEFQVWQNEFSDETVEAHVVEAQSLKLQILMHTRVLPLIFALLALSLFVYSFKMKP